MEPSFDFGVQRAGVGADVAGNWQVLRSLAGPRGGPASEKRASAPGCTSVECRRQPHSYRNYPIVRSCATALVQVACCR
jgi:hypothetical protein